MSFSPPSSQLGSPKSETEHSTVLRRLDVALVIPCFNEFDGIEMLESRIRDLIQLLSDGYSLEVIFVDDGSLDGTGDELERRFGNDEWAIVVRHHQNQGIAAAIMTGFASARYEWVASIDADCTYDPIQLSALLDRVEQSPAMITASPYHPNGKVMGVPPWRLGLSKVASAAYRQMLGMKLHTYTSCFRLARRSEMLKVNLSENGFVGVAEMLWQVKRNGGTIVEVPAVLTSRRIGYSKMKTLPVILAHLKLLSRIALDRVKHPSRYRSSRN